MRVADSSINLQSSHLSYARYRREERLAVRYSPAHHTQAAPAQPEAKVPQTTTGENESSSTGDAKLDLAILILERLLGGHVQPLHLEAARPPESTTTTQAGISLRYDLVESWQEGEDTSVRAEGTVLTGDGKEIRFRLELHLARQLYREHRLSSSLGSAAEDPLVLALQDGSPAFTGERLSFDLHGNGTREALPLPAPGTFYLALDRDGDGHIGNGSELFGPTSGDGFADLAQHDGDSNGWIDSADPIYGKLLLWDGHSSKSLAQTGIAAVYLGRVASPFSLRTPDQAPLAQIRSTGIYLHQDNSAGVVQQLNLCLDA